MSQASIKHHHLPEFYLGRWTGPDGRLCEFSRPYKKLVPKRRYPGGTGYVHRLYETPGLPPDEAQRIEDGFMRPLDDEAAKALTMLETNDPQITRDASSRSAWTRFLISLFTRTPEDVAAAKLGWQEAYDQHLEEYEEKWAQRRGPHDPQTFAAYVAENDPDFVRRCAVEMLPKLIDHKAYGEIINNMRWLVKRVESGTREFFTSDRPILMSPGLSAHDAYLIVPIGPKTLFAAVNNKETQERIEWRDGKAQVEAINQAVIAQAVKSAYARHDGPFRFVERHMGTRRKSTLIERLVERRREHGWSADLSSSDQQGNLSMEYRVMLK